MPLGGTFNQLGLKLDGTQVRGALMIFNLLDENIHPIAKNTQSEVGQEVNAKNSEYSLFSQLFTRMHGDITT
jgi:hypothetical protein